MRVGFGGGAAFTVVVLALTGCPGEIGGTGGTGGSGGGGHGALTIRIAAPAAGPVYTNGSVTMTLAVTGSPEAVVLLSDGMQVATVTSPYTAATLDTAMLSEGPHQITARATRSGGSIDSAPLTVEVDRTAPTVLFKVPETGAAFVGDGVGAAFSEPVSGSGTLSAMVGATAATVGAPVLSADGLRLTASLGTAPTSLPSVLTVSLGGALVDRAGNALAATSWMATFGRWGVQGALTSAAGRVGSFPRVASDANGTVYVAFSERVMGMAGTDQVQVRAVGPGRNELLGSGFAVTSGVAFVDVAVDPMGRPVIAFMEGANVVAKRWESPAWVDLGASVGAGAWPDVAFDLAGNPVVAFTASGTIRVSKWSGTAWVAAAPDLVTLGAAGVADPSGPSLAMNGDVASVAYVEVENVAGGTPQVKVATAAGASWTLLGPVNVRATGTARWPSLGRSGATLFVAWEEDDGFGVDVHVAKRDATSWTRLGRPLDLDIAKNARWPALGVDETGAPIVSWTDDAAWGRFTNQVARYDGTEWQLMGGEEAGGGGVLATSLALLPSGPAVAWSVTGAGVFLARFNGKGLVNAFGLEQRGAASACAPGVMGSTLSSTGCFDVAVMPPKAGTDLVPYEVVAPLWSDGALKRRWVRLPAGGTITYAATGPWDFPEGTVLVKEFSYEQDAADPATRRPTETRFLVKTDAGWDGFSYQWNDAFTDATLLENGDRKTWPTTGSDAGFQQIYPSRDQCGTCHLPAAGFVLGLHAGQLNRAASYAGVADNQLRTMEHLGLFGATGPAANVTERFVNSTDTTETLERRVRGYLAANCSHCHQPGSSRPTRDFRWETPLGSTSICGGANPEVNPGDAGTSLMPRKMMGTAAGSRMPPLATDIVDDATVGVVEEWINAMTSCP